MTLRLWKCGDNSWETHQFQPPTSGWTITALNAMHHPAGTDMKTGLLARVRKESGTDGCHGDTGRWREHGARSGWHGTSWCVLRGSLSLCLFTRLLRLLSYIDQGDGDSTASVYACECVKREEGWGINTGEVDSNAHKHLTSICLVVSTGTQTRNLIAKKLHSIFLGITLLFSI